MIDKRFEEAKAILIKTIYEIEANGKISRQKISQKIQKSPIIPDLKVSFEKWLNGWKSPDFEEDWQEAYTEAIRKEYYS